MLVLKNLNGVKCACDKCGLLASVSVTDTKDVGSKGVAYCPDCMEGHRVLAYFPVLPAIVVVAMLYAVMMGFDVIRSFT